MNNEELSEEEWESWPDEIAYDIWTFPLGSTSLPVVAKFGPLNNEVDMPALKISNSVNLKYQYGDGFTVLFNETGEFSIPFPETVKLSKENYDLVIKWIQTNIKTLESIWQLYTGEVIDDNMLHLIEKIK